MLCPSFSLSEESVTAYRDKSTGLSFLGALPLDDSSMRININIDKYCQGQLL